MFLAWSFVSVRQVAKEPTYVLGAKDRRQLATGPSADTPVEKNGVVCHDYVAVPVEERKRTCSKSKGIPGWIEDR